MRTTSSVWVRCSLTFGLIATSGAALAAGSEMIVNERAEDLVTREVRIGDLDLNNSRDQRTLALRVDRAALAVCDVTPGAKLDRTPQSLQCLDDARAGAIAQLDARGHRASVAIAAANLF